MNNNIYKNACKPLLINSSDAFALEQLINYNHQDYKEIMEEKIQYKEIQDIEDFALKNLEALENLKGNNDEYI